MPGFGNGWPVFAAAAAACATWVVTPSAAVVQATVPSSASPIAPPDLLGGSAARAGIGGCGGPRLALQGVGGGLGEGPSLAKAGAGTACEQDDALG